MFGELDATHYKVLLEGLPCGVYVVDTDRKILFWNQGAERITGYLRHEVIGKFCQDNLLEQTDEQHEVLCGEACPLLETIRDGKPRQGSLFLRHKDGQRIPIHIRTVPLRDADNVIFAAAEVFEERHPTFLQLHYKPPGELEEIASSNVIRKQLQAFIDDFITDRIPFAVLSIAVNELDRIRREKGRAAADKVLQVVAMTLRKNLWEGDLVGLLKDDRLVAVVLDCPVSVLARVRDMLQRVVAASTVSWWGDQFPVTISVGFTVVQLEDTTDSLLERAEQALQSWLGRDYRDKEIATPCNLE
jgi:PAS domain S-box-containing protein